MISKKSNQEIKTRQVKNYGDAAIINGFFSTEWWRELFKHGRGMALLLFSQYYLRFLIWLFANTTGVLYRYRHGKQTMGLISSFHGLMLILLFNSAEIWFCFKPFILFVIPVYYVVIDWGHLYNSMLVDVHSYGLTGLTFIYLALASINVFKIYMGQGNPDPEKRGDSWIPVILAGRGYPVSEDIIQRFIEPAVTILAGLLIWLLNDPVFAVFLWIAGGCTFAQETMDWARQQQTSPRPRQV